MGVPKHRLYVDEGIGERRALIVDAKDRPCNLMLFRNSDQHRAVWGDIMQARITTLEPSAGGAFAKLENGEMAFWPFGKSGARKQLHEGAEMRMQIRHETYSNKLARIGPAGEAEFITDPLERWLAQIPGKHQRVEDSNMARAVIDQAIDTIETRQLTLLNGGSICIEPTTALIAVDVDSSGWQGKPLAPGRAFQNRAFDLNLMAVETSARQMALRQLGGVVVIDCVGNFSPDIAKSLQDIFMKQFGICTSRKLDMAYLARFGQIQASIERRYQPVHERLGAIGGVSHERLVLDAMRALQNEARQNRSAQIYLNLAHDTYEWLQKWPVDWQGALHDEFGARVFLNAPDATFQNRFEVYAKMF